MKILITGAHGFLGGRISEFLKKQKNFKLILLSRKDGAGVKKVNLKSRKSLEKLFKGVDVVINCIGYDINSSVDKNKTNYVNSSIPTLIYEISKKAKVKYFFYISTYHIYNLKKKIDEKSKTISKNLYTRSKILGEKEILKKIGQTKVIVLRLCNLFGYPRYPNKNSKKLLINYLLSKIAKEKKIIIKSKYDEYRYYSSMETFNEYLLRILKNLDKIQTTRKYTVFNYFTERCFNISQLVNFLNRKNLFGKKQIQIQYKHKVLIKRKHFLFTSIYKKYLPKKDLNFFKEIKNTYKYYRNY